MLPAVERTIPSNWPYDQKQMETDEDRGSGRSTATSWRLSTNRAVPMVTIEQSPELGLPPAAEEPEEEEKKMLPNSAVTVANGQLFVATHIDILAKVLADQADRGMLHESSDFQRVEAEVGKLRLSEQSAQTFVRTDDAYRGVYELLRTGRMRGRIAVGPAVELGVGRNSGRCSARNRSTATSCPSTTWFAATWADQHDGDHGPG
jgi:hypothetical protein